MDTSNNTSVYSGNSPGFVKTNIPNLIKLEPMGTYYGRCKVHGKLVRQSLATKDFKVAKSKLLKWLMDSDEHWWWFARHAAGRLNKHLPAN